MLSTSMKRICPQNMKYITFISPLSFAFKSF